MAEHNYFANLIWQIADLLRGPYRPPQYERVMLPMTVLRRFDCVLAPTKAKVLAEYERRKAGRLEGDALDIKLNEAAGQHFHNHSQLNFEKLKGDPDNIEKHLVSYIQGFSAKVRRIFEYFEFETEIEKMREANILYLVVSKFADVDLHPKTVPNEQMGLIFENLIRRFNELANETAGDHFTPREVIRLMVNILFIHDDKLLATPGTVRKLLDPACGTGGMLAEAQSYLREHNAEAMLYVYGQDYNKRAFATAASDMIMKEVSHNGGGNNIRFGDTFTDDQFQGEIFDYFLSNPPFGVDWKKQQKEIQAEHEKRGFDGRFGAGLPRVNDGALLFLQHMWSKREEVKPAEHKQGSRLAIVFSGSPMFTGGAGSGESEIRRWLIENDWLEAIIALPEQMFYNTGIGTYIWIVTNRKERRRKGKIQLLDARDIWTLGGSEDSKRSLGDKRRHMTNDQIAEIVRLYGRFGQTERSKIFDNTDLGYTRVTIERPLRLRYQMTTEEKARFLDACPHLLDDVQTIDKTLGREPHRDWNTVWRRIEEILGSRKSRWKTNEQKLFRSVFTQQDPGAEPVLKASGDYGFEVDVDLRDFENIPLKEDIDAYFEREVRPYAPDAWMDRSKDKVGYEINFSRYFLAITPPRSLAEIDSDLKCAEEEIVRLLKEVTLASNVAQEIDLVEQMRDSGVPWLGKIPAHWEVTRLKFVARVQTGIALGKDYGAKAVREFPYLRVANVQDGFLDLADIKTIAIPEQDALLCQLQSGDVLMNEGGDADKLGRGAIWRGEIVPCLHQNHVFAVRPRRITPEWLNAWTSSGLAKAYFESRAKQSTNLASISATNLMEMPLAKPPEDEQRAIVEHIAREVAKLDKVREAADRTLSLLKERRAALITAAVTGKINVRTVE